MQDTKRNNLIQRRKELGFTQLDMIYYLNKKSNIEISQSYYSRIERGIREPKISVVKAISDVLESKVDKLF